MVRETRLAMILAIAPGRLYSEMTRENRLAMILTIARSVTFGNGS